MARNGDIVKATLLQALQASQTPMSAYELLAVLQKQNPKSAPPTVYRALNALISQGDVHRLESTNAYMACRCDTHEEDAILSICDDCGIVEETVAPEVMAQMTRAIGKSGFAAQRRIIEIHGTCADCGPGQDS